MTGLSRDPCHCVEHVYNAGAVSPPGNNCLLVSTPSPPLTMTDTQVRDRRPADLAGLDAKLGNAQMKTLGHLRLRDAETNEIILIPTPSSDPKDPLNW